MCCAARLNERKPQIPDVSHMYLFVYIPTAYLADLKCTSMIHSFPCLLVLLFSDRIVENGRRADEQVN